MAWFRRDRDARAPIEQAPSAWEVSAEDTPELLDDSRPVRPEIDPPSAADRARIAAALEALAARGVDVDDLASLGAGFDAALAAAQQGGSWADDPVELIGLGIGEHLVRHANFDWSVITDVFGSDLGVAARRGNTSVIPTQVVGARWIGGQTGWLPGLVGHLVRVGQG